MSRRTSSSEGTCIRTCLVTFAVISALLVCGPVLYYKLFNKSSSSSSYSPSSCPSCVCDCPPPLSLLNIAPGLANLSVTDCGGSNSSSDPYVKEEMEKQFVDLVTEELKLEKAVSEAHSRHMSITVGEVKRVASQYQRESEKCIAATETCEAARERADGLLRKERKVTNMWERRARKMGWEGE